MNADANVNVTLVGCGAVARFFYARALAELANEGVLSVKKLVDIDPTACAQLKSWFPRAHAVSHIKDAELLRGELTIIATPPFLHAAQSIAALVQGSAVLCEKPMAVSSMEAQQMLHAAKANEALLAIGLYKRFFPAAEAIKDVIDNAPLGFLKRFSISEGGKFLWQAASDSFFRVSKTPGGVLYDVGIHVLDLLIWWLGEPADLTYEDDAMGGVEANCRVHLSYASGCKGEIRLSRDWPTDNTYTFVFERGVVRYYVNDANRLEITFQGMTASLDGHLREIAVSQSHTKFAQTGTYGFIAQLRNVLATMRGRETLRVPGEEGIRSLRLVEQCYQQRNLMDMPWRSTEEMKEAHRLTKSSAIER